MQTRPLGKWAFHLVFFLMGGGLSGCSLSSTPRDNVVVVAVDHLSVIDALCNKDSVTLGRAHFESLCSESVRFTHAFTNAMLSQPALSTLLTGLEPSTHGVHNNGFNYLPAAIQTVAEDALAKGYHTLFYSGGAPALRSTGLQQGFETFDDSWLPIFSRIYRPAKVNFDEFIQYLKSKRGLPFFSVFYVPDLRFKNQVTVNHLGEERNLSVESQLEEFDESINRLVEFLKKERLWDSTYFVLAGLQGRHLFESSPTLEPVNLYSDMTQVALLIKPAHAPRDEGIHWTIDKNVSLADVGWTLREIVTKEAAVETKTGPTSLLMSLKKAQAPWSSDRPIIAESGWAAWKLGGPLLYSARFDQTLLIQGKRPKLYNTLADQSENTPLTFFEKDHPELLKNLDESPIKRQILIPYKVPFSWQEERLLDIDLWTQEAQASRRLTFLEEALSESNVLPVKNWLATELIHRKLWEKLSELGERVHEQDWSTLAKLNLGILAKAKFQNPCLEIMKQTDQSQAIRKKCRNAFALLLADWIEDESKSVPASSERERRRRLILKTYYYSLLDRKIAEFNRGLQWIWDFSPQREMGPSVAEMVLALPSMGRHRAWIEKEVNQLRLNHSN